MRVKSSEQVTPINPIVLSEAKDLPPSTAILRSLRFLRLTSRCFAMAALIAACSRSEPPARSTRPDSVAVATNATPPSVAVADSARLDSVALASAAAAAATAKAAEKDDAPPYHGPSTLDGLYTDEQAARGRDVYFGSCRSCHSPQSHTGATFATWWRGKQLSDLFDFVSQRMPKNDPGSLAPEDVADVVAYLLKMNALPTGPAELYPDPDSLKQYRIETRRRRTTSTATRTQP
jgi:mono/diheme cytochrome c family protein